jgi:lipopolysaccharide transport system permease protein
MSLTTEERAGGLEVAAPPQTARGAAPPPPPHTPSTLPDKPVVTIEPRRTRLPINFAELWAYRELLYFLTWRDIKVRYKQAAFGVAWAVLQPLFLMLIFTLFYGRLAGVETGGVPYPLFAFSGLVLWTFFANAVSGSGNSLVGNANLITKVYFPRMLVPAAAVAACLVDFALTCALLVVLMIFYGVAPSAGVLLLPAIVLMATLFALGTGMWLSALNVKYRDIRFAMPFMIQLWLFVSSVIIPSSAVPARWRWLLALNPMSGYVEGARAALFGGPFDWGALASAAAITAAVLVYAAFEFRRMEKNFADVI